MCMSKLLLFNRNGGVPKCIVFILLVFPFSAVFATSATGSIISKLIQEQYKGKVVDENGASMSGVTVRNIKTKAGAVTDSFGSFTISGNPDDIITITYTGYGEKEMRLAAVSAVPITLSPTNQEMEEIVVVGYNALKESNISGAISRVDMKMAEKRRVQDVGQLLQGQTTGVNVTQSTGQPGDAIDIRIRGVGTIGNNSPLFVIDGVPTTNVSFINPADIESMSVLKDASAASMYGSRAAAGVILIKTKKGQIGATKFNANLYTGLQRVSNLPIMMNTEQYLSTMETAWKNSYGSTVNPYTKEKERTGLADTDWLSELFEKGKTQSFQLGASGGTEKATYMFSSGYYNQDGVVRFENDRYQRLEFRSNVSAKLTERIELKSNILLNHQNKMVVSSRGDVPGIIRHAILRPPVLSVYKNSSDPTYSARNPFTDLPFYNGPNDDLSDLYEKSQNPVALAYFSNNNQKQFKVFGNVEGQVLLLTDKSLIFRSSLGLEMNFNHNKSILHNFGDDDGGGGDADKGKGLGRINRPNGLNEDRGDDYTLTWNNVLTYDKTFGDHLINSLAGTEFINNTSSSINASRRRFEYESDRFQYMDLGGTALDLWNGGYAQEWSLFSLFASATYAYKNKYSVTGNIRADASSRFGENNKWGHFPSVAVGWTLTNEDFIAQNDVLNYLKIRASSGKLGNQNIMNYAYLTLFSREGEINRYGNPDLKWESTQQNNLGFDARLFRNKLELNADVFYKKTKDILLAVSLPSFVGNVDATYVNAGQVDNKGFELNLRYSDKVGGDFRYSLGGNLTGLKNKVVALHENVPRIIGKAARAEIGQPLDVYYGYVMEGIYQNENEINEHLFSIPNPSSQPGDIRFKDLNKDGFINDADREFIGNPIPKWSYGFFVSGDYKGFDASVFFQGVQDVDRYNDGIRLVDFDTRRFNYTTRMLGAWNGEGSSNTLPRVAFEDTGVSRFSTLYIEDASYLRLKNIEIGYSFGRFLSKYKINNARFYISAQNLLTWTKYTGLDPETTDLIDAGTYPQAKSFIVGLNFNF